MQEINERIRHYRRLKGFTQTQVAEYLGVKCSTYSQMERKGIITAEAIIKLSELFQIDSNALLYGESEKEAQLINVLIDGEELYLRKKEQLEWQLATQFEFLKKLSKSEYQFINIICRLNRKQRNAVYEHAYKIFNKEIKID